MKPSIAYTRDLEQRLAEALATIEALVAGQIDAVVDSESKSPVLLTKALAGLRESEERYREIVETTHEGIAMINPSSKITFVNRRLTEMFGYRAEDMLGSSMSRFMPDNPEVCNNTSEKSVRYVRKDGSELWALVKTSTIRSTTGEVIGTLVMVTDRTARMVAEEALGKSEEQYRQIVETTTDGIIKFSTDGEITFVNRRLAEMLGYEPREMIGLNIFAFVSPSADAATADFLKGDQIGVAGALDTTFRHENGRDIAVNVARTPLFDDMHRQVGSLGMVRDVTQQKKLEEQLRQSQKMDAVGQLAGGMAHDFNNLLTVINGYSDLAIARLPPNDPLQQDMEQIKTAGRRAAALTRQLLAFSRKQVLLPTILDLNSVISELEKMLRRLIGEDVVLRTDLAPDAGSVKADRGQIEQVVMNFVINARDAMPDGGQLTIETLNVDLTEEFARQHLGVKPGPYVMLAVTDSGCGMDAQTQSRIFEPFFTTKEAGKGTGLGLSTVYGIVQQSGGSIWVYSEIGRGSTFTVYLPRLGADSKRFHASTKPADVTRGTETILLIEDDEMVRTLATRVLRMYGYRVLKAEDGRTGIAVAEQQTEPIDLLITDIVMPGMHGRDLADRLSSSRPDMKVLFMSGYTDKAVVQQQGVDEESPFIQKPFSPQTLASKVRELLDKN